MLNCVSMILNALCCIYIHNHNEYKTTIAVNTMIYILSKESFLAESQMNLGDYIHDYCNLTCVARPLELDLCNLTTVT